MQENYPYGTMKASGRLTYCKEIKPVNPQGNQPFIGKADAGRGDRDGEYM